MEPNTRKRGAAILGDARCGTWGLRPVVEQRIREKLERSIPDAATRTAALRLFAFALENADEERGDAWYVRETSTGLRLMTGGLLACEVARKKLRVSVIGPVSEETRAALSADTEDDGEFVLVPGGLIEAVAYVGRVVGRDLPQPEPAAEVAQDADDVGDEADDVAARREPCIRGRTQRFERSERSIVTLMAEIEREVIALPDLQRPFVWEDSKVRDLLDSLFLGFPVGTLVLWHTATEKAARAVGTERTSNRPTTLIIDGQQRLTALSAVIRGVEVVGKDGEKRRVTIAFRPRDGRFEVADAAIVKDPEFLANVTELWTAPARTP